jgi:hypothetical protein
MYGSPGDLLRFLPIKEREQVDKEPRGCIPLAEGLERRGRLRRRGDCFF